MAQPLELSLISETEFESRAPSGLPAGCPTLDLAATWDSSGRNLLIYRPPGQVVSRIHQVGLPGKKVPEAVAVTWKPDGSSAPLLGIRWPFPAAISFFSSRMLSAADDNPFQGNFWLWAGRMASCG